VNFASKEYKNRSAYKGAQIIPIGIPTDFWYKDIVDEEFQHLFNFNFRVPVREIRVVSNKDLTIFSMTEH
jgi:hypothetical protein